MSAAHELHVQRSRTAMAHQASCLDRLANDIGRPVQFMEICGTHTVNACRSGVHSLMPGSVRLVSGPGCPVCVTAQRYIDALVDLGRRPSIVIATYGDMLRVAGAGGSLEVARSEGADVRVVTSSLEALDIARRHPEREVVFAAVGFETTAPATAAAILAARREGVRNFTVLAQHKRVLPAMTALLADSSVRIDGFLCPGHVAVIIGSTAFLGIVESFRTPCAISGFTAAQIMDGILNLAKQVACGRADLVNRYVEAVTDAGNRIAQALMHEVFEPGDACWRALGEIPDSGLDIRDAYRDFDAFDRHRVTPGADREPPGCRCAEVITGRCIPSDCPLFGRACTPVYPVGPCMVSSEGSCQAFFRYRRHEFRRNPDERRHTEPIVPAAATTPAKEGAPA